MADVNGEPEQNRHTRLQQRYEDLVGKYRQTVAQRSHSHWLGSWLIHEAHDGVVLIRGEQISIANRSFYELAPHRRMWVRHDEPEARPTTLVDGLIQALRELRAEEVTAKLHFRSVGSTARLVEARLQRIEHSPDQTAVLVRDLSDQEQIRQQTEQAERRDQFMAVLAHELRNPLAPIVSAAELIVRGTDPDAVRHAAEIILRQARHQARLVDDLLDTARVRQGKIVLRRRPHDLRALLREAVDATELHRQQHQIELELLAPNAPVWAWVDSTRVVQCVVNLLINAAKFTLPGGKNRLAVETEEELVWIHLEDNGIGIDPPMLDRIFEVFTQADESLAHSKGGLGLGLPLVRALAELHGGGIQAVSDGLGQGTRFSLWLPLLSSAEPQPAESAGVTARSSTAPEQRTPAPQRVVLVVEDNADARETLCELLESSGHLVFAACDGTGAVEAARECRPDVVVSDIGLPGMDGFELARQLRVQAPDLRLIALSGYSQQEDRQRAAEAGFDAYLVKPVDTQALIEAVAGLSEP